MQRVVVLGLAAAAMGLVNPAPAHSQNTQEFLPAGTVAPDIQVTGATRYGVLSDPVKLSDFRGETLILAFFFRARSSG